MTIEIFAMEDRWNTTLKLCFWYPDGYNTPRIKTICHHGDVPGDYS